MHADGAFLPRWQFPKRPDIKLRADIELSFSFIEHLLDGPTLFLMLFSVFVLTFLVAIPNAQAPVTLLEGVTFLTASRTQLC